MSVRVGDIDWTDSRAQFRLRLRERIASAIKPPEVMQVDEWADTYRVLNKEAGAVGGRFRTADVEIARGPMRAVMESSVSTIAIAAATQLMKTTILENAIGAMIHLDPANIIVVQPNESFVKKFSEKKLKPFILATKELLEAFGGKHAFLKRSAENSIGEKKFTGGAITITAAGSPSNASMLTADLVVMDEVDNFPPMTTEGNIIRLFLNRLFKSRRAMAMMVCSPTVAGASNIESLILKSDRRRAYVACPCCGHEQILTWENVRFKDENGKVDPELAAYHCESCEKPWPENERKRLMMTKDTVLWRQTRHFTCCEERQDPQINRLWDGPRALCKTCGKQAVPNRNVGFDEASALYSPEESLPNMAQEWLDCQGSREDLMTFVNTRLAKTFARAVGAKVFEMEGAGLQGRAEPAWKLLPNKIKVITIGVDVQKDRLEAQVVGWGDGEENWALEYHVIPGDPNHEETWKVLDTYIRAYRSREDGTSLPVAATCVDAAYLSDTVYGYCNARSSSRVWATMGAPNPYAHVFPKVHNVQDDKRRALSFGARYYMIGTQAAKDKVRAMMTAAPEGQLAMHIPDDRENWWFDQMTSEKKVQDKNSKGEEIYVWKKKYDGIRNEAWDTYVYAYAALHGLRRMGILRNSHLAPPSAALERMTPEAEAEILKEGVPTASPEQPASTLSQAAAAQIQAPRRPKSAPSSFSKSFKAPRW